MLWFTPLALVHARGLIQLNSSIGFLIAALVRAVGHLALVCYAFSSRLIRSVRAKTLFLAAVIEATMGAAGAAILVVAPEAVPIRGIHLITAVPPLLAGAIALVPLSARSAHPRSADRHP